MTFSKHNWNQLSESSKRELQRREAYKQGYQDTLNEQASMRASMSQSGAGASRSASTNINPDLAPPGGWNTGYEGQYWEDKYGNSYEFKNGRWVHLSKLSGSGVNEQAEMRGGMGMSTTAPKMPPSGGGMPGSKSGAGKSPGVPGGMGGRGPKQNFHPALREYWRDNGHGYGQLVPTDMLPGETFAQWSARLRRKWDMNR